MFQILVFKPKDYYYYICVAAQGNFQTIYILQSKSSNFQGNLWIIKFTCKAFRTTSDTYFRVPCNVSSNDCSMAMIDLISDVGLSFCMHSLQTSINNLLK